MTFFQVCLHHLTLVTFISDIFLLVEKIFFFKFFSLMCKTMKICHKKKSLIEVHLMIGPLTQVVGLHHTIAIVPSDHSSPLHWSVLECQVPTSFNPSLRWHIIFKTCIRRGKKMAQLQAYICTHVYLKYLWHQQKEHLHMYDTETQWDWYEIEM
jgi:hypothetical protein